MMLEKTLEALKDSIAKWKKNCEVKSLDNVLLGSSTCPLCNLFNPSGDLYYEDKCVGCPVYENTGTMYCNNTPYEQIEDDDVDFDTFIELAHEEVKFLESLLPTS